MFCKNCGKELADTAFMCPNCGAPTQANTNYSPQNAPTPAPKDWLTTLLLCLFLGGFGIHSFYTGKTAIGVIQLLTLGGCVIWALIDLIMILCGSYKDGQGRPLVKR